MGHGAVVGREERPRGRGGAAPLRERGKGGTTREHSPTAFASSPVGEENRPVSQASEYIQIEAGLMGMYTPP